MTLNDFHSRFQVRLDVFFIEYKELHKQNPVSFPLELDSFLEWQENFVLFSEDLELHPEEIQPQIYQQLENTLRCS